MVVVKTPSTGGVYLSLHHPSLYRVALRSDSQTTGSVAKNGVSWAIESGETHAAQADGEAGRVQSIVTSRSNEQVRWRCRLGDDLDSSTWYPPVVQNMRFCINKVTQNKRMAVLRKKQPLLWRRCVWGGEQIFSICTANREDTADIRVSALSSLFGFPHLVRGEEHHLKRRFYLR